LTISSGFEKNLNFLDDVESDKSNELNIARINLDNEQGQTATEIPVFKKHMKRFSIDDLRNHSSYNINSITNSSSNNLERMLKQQQMNIVNDISEFHNTNSDYSLTSGISSNFSTSPIKRFINPNNFSQISPNNPNLNFNNNIFNEGRRNSCEMNPNLLNVMRDIVGRGNISRSARNSKDFSNMQGVFNIPFNILDDKYILDNMLMLLKDQNGCRLIQKKIEEKPTEFVYPMFETIQNNLPDIMADQFGNYVVQKIIDYIYNDKVIITKFFEVIRSQIYNISVNQFGTRVLQRLLDYFCVNYSNVETPGINDVLKSLIVNHPLELIMDTNGNHVFQKILMIYPKQENQFIYDELIKIGIEVAKSKKGGCIFQRAFEHASTGQKVTHLII
jgi:hypothetical protein